MDSAQAIRVEGLVKRYGGTTALAGVDLSVPAGTVLGLLGPNGAGKTTIVRILATLLRADGGTATVCGHDVGRHPNRVRATIGLTGQYAAVDEELTGLENLLLVARLLELPRTAIRRRAGELLERFDLVSAAGRPVKTYSGGMRRRLDVALSVVNHPRVLFLDEPTTGLDPRSRREAWAIMRGLVAEGTTVLLTTQDLLEADSLADEIAVLHHGRIIASGPPAELKAKLGGQTVDLRPEDPERLDAVAALMERMAGARPTTDPDRGVVSVAVPAGVVGTDLLTAVLGGLAAASVPVAEAILRLASLDEVFLMLTSEYAEQPNRKGAGRS